MSLYVEIETLSTCNVCLNLIYDRDDGTGIIYHILPIDRCLLQLVTQPFCQLSRFVCLRIITLGSNLESEAYD